MSIPRVFHGLDRKVFLSPKLLGTTTNLEWHICAGKCRKYAKKCRKYAKICQKQSKLIIKAAETRPKLYIFTSNESLYKIRVLGRKLDHFPLKVVAGNLQEMTKNCRK